MVQRYFQPAPEPTIMTVCAWADVPDAGSYPGSRIRVTDVGPNGADFRSTGTSWVPVYEHLMLDYMPIPIVKSPTLSSVSATGAIVLGTAVSVRFGKCFMYFAAGQLFSDDGGNAAGFYYTEMSDTSNAVVYNNTYTPAAGTRPEAPASPTAFSGKTGATGGALAGSTDAITFFTTSIPAGLLGDYGALRTRAMFEVPSGTNAKPHTVVFGGSTATGGGASMTSTQTLYGEHIIRNRGTGAQRCSPNFTNSTTGNPAVSIAVDTTAAVTVSYTIRTSAAATDWAACSALYVNVEVFE